MGITSGKLEELKHNITVKAIETNTKKFYSFDYIQITDQYAIRFQDKYNVEGTFEVTAYYKNYDIKCSGSNILKIIA